MHNELQSNHNDTCTHAIKFIAIKNSKVCSKGLQTGINIERQCSAHLLMFSVDKTSSHIHSINKLQFFKVTCSYSFAVGLHLIIIQCYTLLWITLSGYRWYFAPAR